MCIRDRYISGAVNANESTLSNIPPCPGIKLPESLYSAALLTKDSTKSPKIDTIDAKRLITKQCLVEISGIEFNSYFVRAIERLNPNITAKNTPPETPSQVFLGEIRLQNQLLPNTDPTTKHPISVIKVTQNQYRIQAIPSFHQIIQIGKAIGYTNNTKPKISQQIWLKVSTRTLFYRNGNFSLSYLVSRSTVQLENYHSLINKITIIDKKSPKWMQLSSQVLNNTKNSKWPGSQIKGLLR
eukprot:TRINITY_DN5259_c0_g1_i8.p2 TRINITY_DN5259_c0_g1~~TRINITY_DN5259_c0_g1_i8.p2  ORF type:complete len:241 (+),score=4.36 TRINITY_DN5259_c0_g1_i8:65-787(+)